MTFEEWFKSESMDCYGKNSEEYKVSLKTWNHQQEKIDAALKLLNDGMWVGDQFMVDANKIEEALK